ncbi:MAG: outer membrane lipoprotein carrier protein LolA [Acidobacteriota bacterium]|jgi:outer membrane lipoprotein-sorting protein
MLTRLHLPRIVAALSLLLPLSLLVADSGGTPAELDRVLERFTAAQDSTDSLRCRFEERKELSLLKEPVVQTGVFYHSKPGLYLWDYQSPTQKQVLLTDEVLLAYYPDLNRAEEVNVRRWTNRIRQYLGVGEDPEALRQDYEISLGSPDDGDLVSADVLVLVPKTPKMKKRLTELRIWLDAKTGQTRRVSYLNPDGDRTTFTFSNIQVNPEIDASRYEIELPRNVKMGDTFSGFSG